MDDLHVGERWWVRLPEFRVGRVRKMYIKGLTDNVVVLSEWREDCIVTISDGAFDRKLVEFIGRAEDD